MESDLAEPAAPVSPLETFVRDYVEVIGGVWDEVEPQVYDLLIPGAAAPSSTAAEGRELVRVAFDPEAIPENPGSQLASFGTPLIERLLNDALRRGRHAQLYLIGLNLTPHDLAGRVRRALTLVPDLTSRLERVRAMHFAEAVFWFQATFVSDRKEQEIVPMAMDLHYNREVRHLEQLLDHSRLAETPSLYLPESRRSSLALAYPIAREHVLRTLGSLINTRAREVSDHMERQIARMIRYYADLREELDEQERRARGREEDLGKFVVRRETLAREERLRVAELRQKSALRIQLRLLTVLVIQQPKLLLRAVVSSAKGEVGNLELVWDPLTEALEAVPCPMCQRPTFTLEANRLGQLVCPACASAGAAQKKHGHR